MTADLMLDPAIGWQADFIGKPWVWRTRGPHTFDCWGLVCAVWQEFADVTLPDYLDQTPTDAAAGDRYRLSSRCLQSGQDIMTPLTAPRPLAICLMRHGAYPSHVGLYAHGGIIVHACENTGRVIQVPACNISPRICGYFWPSDFIMKASA